MLVLVPADCYLRKEAVSLAARVREIHPHPIPRTSTKKLDLQQSMDAGRLKWSSKRARMTEKD